MTSFGVSRGIADRLAHLSVMQSEFTHDGGLEPVFSLSELAGRLGVPAQTIYDLRSQGRGPRGFRLGKELKFRASEVEAWLRRLEEADEVRHPGAGR